MKIVLFSNFLNHHQIPLASAFNKTKDVEYVFVANTPFDQQRKAMGYEDVNRKYDYVLRAYESKDNERLAHQLALEGDIVMVGDSSLDYMMDRLRYNRITFRVCERLFKNGVDSIHLPINIARAYKHKLFQCRNKPLFFLAMSGYLAYDVNCFVDYSDRVFKWGYFIDNIKLDYNEIKREKGKNRRPKILWIGRLLRWKHPEAVVRLACKLKEKGYDFECNIYGEGEMKNDLTDMIEINKLEKCVHLKGFISQDQVRSEMENSNIFLFTSDHNEGWGAVLGEAMSSGCAVVASHACGAAPFLIKKGINGFTYQCGNEEDLFSKTETLLNNQGLRDGFGKQAFQDMRMVWDADIAAQRLIILAQALEQRKGQDMFTDGPCSIAPIIKDF